MVPLERGARVFRDPFCAVPGRRIVRVGPGVSICFVAGKESRRQERREAEGRRWI